MLSPSFRNLNSSIPVQEDNRQRSGIARLLSFFPCCFDFFNGKTKSVIFNVYADNGDAGLRVCSTTFTFVNKCAYTVWPGILSNAGVSPLSNTGFALQTDESKALTAPTSWAGRFWGRTHCSEDSTGKFSCATGDCGSNKVECSGNGAQPPATLVEFTLDGAGGLDFFDVSLVDGYNLPMMVVPEGGTGQNCTSTGCLADLNSGCPSVLKVTSGSDGEGVACKSACEAFNQPEYCCNGAYSTPDTCQPSSYAKLFKDACPLAYSYAYDDKTSTFTCANADYVITFCPTPNTSQKSAGGQGSQTTSSPTVNVSMVYAGATPDYSGGPPSGSHDLTTLVRLAGAILMLFFLN